MKKAKLIVSSLCLIAVLALAMPATVCAIDTGPQGGANGTRGGPPPPPPPPPPTNGGGGLLGEIIALLLLP